MSWHNILKILFLLATAVGLLISCGGNTPTPSAEDYLQREKAKGQAFVSPKARQKGFHKVAVMPFRAPVELAGASIADMFTTELLSTGKYKLVERSQMEQVLGEQALELKGVTTSTKAIEVGKILGVQGVIIGTVPEYGYRAVGSVELPAIGLNARMIDVEDGSIVWSVSNSAIAKTPTSLSVFAQHLVCSTVDRLVQEWRRVGDTHKAAYYQNQKNKPWNGQLKFNKLRFFECPFRKRPKLSQRQYLTRFPSLTTRAVYVELCVKNALYGIRKHKHKMAAQYYDPNGNLWGKLVESKKGYNMVVKPHAKVWHKSVGRGWKKSGKWKTGTYSVEVFVDGERIAEEQFTIY